MKSVRYSSCVMLMWSRIAASLILSLSPAYVYSQIPGGYTQYYAAQTGYPGTSCHGQQTYDPEEKQLWVYKWGMFSHIHAPNLYATYHFECPLPVPALFNAEDLKTVQITLQHSASLSVSVWLCSAWQDFAGGCIKADARYPVAGSDTKFVYAFETDSIKKLLADPHILPLIAYSIGVELDGQGEMNVFSYLARW